MQYVSRWRRLAAAHALRHLDRTVASVAVSVGYSSVAAFGRAFMRFAGQSPAADAHAELPAFTPGAVTTPARAPATGRANLPYDHPQLC
jgi:AraC-like DNA-binding protein